MPYDDEGAAELGRLVGALQDLLLSAQDLECFLEGVASVACHVVEPPASVGITVGVGERLTTVVASDERAAQVDEVQYEKGTGPCLDALDSGTVVEVRDQEQDDRWPPYRDEAVRLGVRCSLALPLRSHGQTLGALNVYGFDRPREFGEDERRRIESFTGQAATAVALAVERKQQRDLAAQLEQALVSRSVIDQAIGILMAQEKCNAETAFELLRKHSQNTNRKLRQVAADVVIRVTGEPPRDPAPFRSPGDPPSGA